MAIVIHVGFPKTGTTTLQQQVYPVLPGVTLVTRRSSHGDEGYGTLGDAVCREPDESYGPDRLAAFLRRSEPPAPAVLVVSDEVLTGKGIGGRPRTARRLQQAAPEARILVTIRNQRTMLPSLYAQHVRGRSGGATFAQFVTGRIEALRFDPSYARYDTVIEDYQNLFGADRVKVLLFEHLVSDPERFLDDVATFVTGRPVGFPIRLEVENRSLSRPSLWVLRHSNRVFGGGAFNPRPVRPAPRVAARIRRGVAVADPLLFSRIGRKPGRADRALLDSICETYREGNARIARATGLDLNRYGYPMP